VPDWRKSLDEVTRIDKSSLSFSTGLRAAVLVMAPLALGLAAGHSELIYATLGAFFVTNTEGPPRIALPLRVVLLACFTEAAAFALGTLVGTTGLLSIPLMGIGVFVALLASGNPRLTLVGTFTAISFVVGVGLPGGSISVTGDRLWLSLAGGLWALFGAWVHRSKARNRSSRAAGGPLDSAGARLRHYLTPARLGSGEFRYAVVVGVASAAGFAIGLALGLPRDFWIVVTIVIALRPRLGPTVATTAMIVVGTIAGAATAGAISLGIANVIILEVLMFAFAVSLFSTRGVNLGLVQVSLTPFIIILLNLLYPGQWQLAGVRILDVVIGGALAIATVYLVARRGLMGGSGKAEN
jgi:fusaric acid resistance family protein